MGISKRNHLIVLGAFLVLVTVSGLLAFRYSNIENVVKITSEGIQYKKNTQDLYSGISLERDQRGLSRGRFVKFEDNSIYLEYYYRFADGNSEASEVFQISDSTNFNCEERYFVTPDGTKIDKFNAMTDTSNYNGEYVNGGLGRGWFEKNAKLGEAVEVQLLGDGTGREPARVLLYKVECKT